MKKVRIMLAAIIILGAVGGALAEKAKRFGASAYCTTNNPVATVCPLPLTNASFIAGGNVPYVSTNNTTNCNIVRPLCTSKGAIIN